MGSRIHQKTAIYLAAVLATVALSACGEKKEARGSQPAAEAPKSTTTVEQQSADGGIPLPPPVAPNASGTPGAPIPAPSPTPRSAVNVKDPIDVDSGYQPVDPRMVEKADFQKRLTGMADEEGLLFTGSSPDYLLTYLRLRNEDPNLDIAVRARNLEAAQSIQSARLSRDAATGDVVVTLKILEGQFLKNYVLAGALDEENEISKLTLTRGTRGVKTTGEQSIRGKIKCLDENGGCETTFARFVIGDEPGSRAAVAILFRTSLADVRASLSASSGNPEYENIRKFWINSHNEANTDFRLKSAKLKSFEIVNGRSGFEVQLKGYNRQLISFGGPLLAPDAGTAVSITADRTAELQESFDLDGISNYKFDLANFIGSAKIINNNGLGQVRLAVKMRKRVGYEPETFKLTIMRIIKPTVTPNEENLKFN